ncbi:Serine/threonine-protein kinase haspin [Cichlidogyrus casuarinus]|uniref:non-specific serine/threonine protein kinase n=1 Tax=Cichlidogyrus casuarinus TaxID=1844966 RepID=A0ABD2QN20_9PLAT
MKTRSSHSVFEVPQFPASSPSLNRRILRSNSIAPFKSNYAEDSSNFDDSSASIPEFKSHALPRLRKRSSASLQPLPLAKSKRHCDSTRSSPALSPRVTRRTRRLSRVSRSLKSTVDHSSDSNSLMDSDVTSLAEDSTQEISIFNDTFASNFDKNKAQKIKRHSNRKFEFDDSSVSVNLEVSAIESRLDQSLLLEPREKLLELCKQTEVKPFDEFFDQATLDGLVKIGEGVYGEVFQTSARKEVIKIFPVGGSDFVNGEEQMAFSDVYPEVFVSGKLTDLSFKVQRNRTVNFVQLKKCALSFMSKASLVQGKLPAKIVEHWHLYAKSIGTDNECLDFLPEEQEWMVLEFDYGGTPLASMKFTSCREARSVFEQVALSLAAAESALQFEHRDLHWLNILVRPTKAEKLRYKIDGVAYHVPTHGIQVTIIDFTVSRMCHDGNVVYVDLNDSPEIFECQGDYQYEIYRMMRDYNKNEEVSSAVQGNPDFSEYTYEQKLSFSSPIANPIAPKKCMKKLAKLLNEARAQKKIYTGTKDVCKQIIKKGTKGIVLLAGDCYPIDLISHIPAVCEKHQIPYCYFPMGLDIGTAINSERGYIAVLITPADEYQEKYDKCYSMVDAFPIPC